MRESMDRDDILQLKPETYYDVSYFRQRTSDGEPIIKSVTGQLNSIHPEDDDIILFISAVINFEDILSARETNPSVVDVDAIPPEILASTSKTPPSPSDYIALLVSALRHTIEEMKRVQLTTGNELKVTESRSHHLDTYIA